MDLSLPDLRLAVFRFDLEALTPLVLPAYKGSTLRGGFGYQFKKIACAQPFLESCAPCLLRHTCIYPFLFEASPPPGAEVLRKNDDLPQPFVIEPPLDRRTAIPAGDRLAFNVVLMGRAIDYLPYFILAFRDLGPVGLGSRDAHYRLRQVSGLEVPSGETRPVYDGRDLVTDNLARRAEFGAAQIQQRANALSGERLTVRFLTPTRLKHEGQFARRPDFHILIRALLRRISTLAYFYCGAHWELDFKRVIAAAETVQTTQHAVEWVDVERFSTRQQEHVKLGGVVGEMTYAGDLAPFRALLALGEWTHVGKGTVFGNGQYRLAA
jgi:hypothetical protein